MSRRFATGLVVGKFAPLHRGHELVIRRALEECDRVYILSYTNPEYPGCEPARRAKWLAQIFPQAERLVVGAENIAALGLGPMLHNDDAEEAHRDFVARACEVMFHARVEAVFGSDAYLVPFAEHLTRRFRNHQPNHPGVHAVLVDASREMIPASGTLLREDVHAHRHLLSPVVYADFVKRICLLGGESSGKSTLAQVLAAEWNTTWVHEFGREYWLERGGVLTFDDLTHIGREQCRREDAAAGAANRFLFCDTSPLTTLFYCQHDFGRASPELTALAHRPYDLTLLCAPDIPFDQDGTRQPPEFRALQHAWYVRELAERGVPYTLVEGDMPQRLARVRELLSD
jgi:NadR type nicotinamide-nucleotide adenylyltransferase